MSIAKISRKLRRYQTETQCCVEGSRRKQSHELTTAALISRYLKKSSSRGCFQVKTLKSSLFMGCFSSNC